MKTLTILPAFALACAVAACSKDTPSTTTTTTSATVAATTAAPTPKPDCAAGMTKIADYGACIKLPGGYTQDPPHKQEDADYPFAIDFPKDGSKFSGFTIRISTKKFADAKESMSSFLDTKHYNVKGSGDLADGKGFWVFSTPLKGDGYTVAVEVQAAKWLISCESGGNCDPKEGQQTLDVCKTIVPYAI